jgi:CRP/FNR family transcriptional regulator
VKRHSAIEIQHKCLNCGLRSDGFFCNFSESILQSFYSLKITNSYPKGATLFYESEHSNGVYMLCQGRVKLSTYSKDGRALILRIADAGELLGLSASITDSIYEATAEAIEPCQINFVRKSDLLRFLREHADAGLNALKQLSRNYHSAYTQASSLGLSSTVGDKLIKLLLSWCVKPDGTNGEVHLKVAFSHEDMAEMIGTSRETVTRLLKEFRDLDLISLKGSDLHIHDRKKFEAAIGTGISPRHIV